MIKRKRNLEDIFKSAKIFLKNLNTKKDITRITISQVLSKVLTKKKIQMNNMTFVRLRLPRRQRKID